MGIAERALVEMEQRSGLLRAEVEAWNARAETNVDKFGRHRSQLRALQEMMARLLQKQAPLLEQLGLATDAQGFAAAHGRLVGAIVGAHELWNVFRPMFDQTLDPQLGPLLKGANAVAADCYLALMAQPRLWKLVSEDRLREPPLVYLVATDSAATAGRGYTVEVLGLAVNRYRSQRLPIPIVLLPFDQAGLPWMLCPLLHEAGHNVDQDLKLVDELAGHLDAGLVEPQVPGGRAKVWKQWCTEILADALGVLSGGAGFAHCLAAILLIEASKAVTLDLARSHPAPYVRMHLLAALLDQAGALFQEEADGIRASALALPPPVGAEGYVDDCALVASVFLAQPLVALGSHALQDLNPSLAAEAAAVQKVVKFFGSGSEFDRPYEALPARLVPPAAQLAWARLDTPDLAALSLLRGRATSYLDGLKQPEFLAGVDRSQFMSELVDAIRFEEEVP